MPRRSTAVRTLTLLAVAGIANSGTGSAQAHPLAPAIRQFAKRHDFNGTVLVERAGRTLYFDSFGIADRAFAVPMRRDTKFRIASITKLFTSVLVLQLHEEGKLDLQAPIHRYLPEYAGEGGATVTIHQLLNHTSGIENYEQVKSYQEALTKGMANYQLPHTSSELLSRYSSGKLVHPPGKEFDYNNADYIILGKIIEQVTGQPYDSVLRKRILGPLGLQNTGMAYQQNILAGLAPTYMRSDSTAPLANDLPVYTQNWYAAGSMYSTAEDLRVFARALYAGHLLREESRRLLLTPGLDQYGYGLWVPTVDVSGKPHRVAQRPGQIMGANVVLLRYLDDDLTVIVLSNTNLTNIDGFAYYIGGEVLR